MLNKLKNIYSEIAIWWGMLSRVTVFIYLILIFWFCVFLYTTIPTRSGMSEITGEVIGIKSYKGHIEKTFLVVKIRRNKEVLVHVPFNNVDYKKGNMVLIQKLKSKTLGTPRYSFISYVQQTMGSDSIDTQNQ